MPSGEAVVKTVILRFRDLVTRKGETIALHREVIEKREFVWWGWWNKAGERIPDEVFRRLKQATPPGLPLLLVDSGRHQVFRAVCTDILWSATQEAVPSPRKQATPAYYKDQLYRAWFKFSEISPDSLDESILQSYTYVRVDSFFEGGASRYLPFYDKRIYSLDELIQQNRTMWFVRDAVPSDPIHEISLLDRSRIEPGDFPRDFRVSASTNLLWVSDLHYSMDGHHGFPVNPTVSQDSVGSAIEKCLRAESLVNLAGVIVSGDLTWRADPREYDAAISFFEWQRKWAGLSNYDFVVCPGNHDLEFTTDPSRKDLPVSETSDVTRRAYVEFYRRLFFKPPNQFLSSGRKFLVGNAFPVEIVCLNSSLLQQQKKLFQGHGFLGEGQLEDAGEQMGWNAQSTGPRTFRIVVLHHHLMPVTFREEPTTGQPYSVVLDAEALVRWLVRHRVALVLHGHMHQPFAARVERPVDPAKPEPLSSWHRFHVVGLGSTGVKGHLGEVGRNTFGVLRFTPTHLDLRLYAIAPNSPAQALWSLHIPYAERQDR